MNKNDKSILQIYDMLNSQGDPTLSVASRNTSFLNSTPFLKSSAITRSGFAEGTGTPAGSSKSARLLDEPLASKSAGSTPFGASCGNTLAESSISASSILGSSPTEDVVKVNILSKEGYAAVVRAKRNAFVHTHFGKELDSFFRLLRDDAEHMRSCHRQITFELPPLFDEDKTEAVLVAYFTDMGYKPLTELRKPDVNSGGKITITIT